MTTTSKLRPYQREALDAIHERLAVDQSTLAVLATGTGKTQIFCHLIQERLKQGRAMIVAHRDELIGQAAHRIESIVGQKADIEMAERWAGDGTMHGGAPIVVASIQSLCSGERLSRFNPDEFATLIIDEAHHAVANTYLRVLEHFRTSSIIRILGVTATPDRKDEEALGQVFQSVAYDYEIIDAVIDGWLVRPLCRTVKLHGLDLSGVRTVAGEFNGRDLANELSKNQNLEAIAAAIIENSGDRRTLVFSDSITESVVEDDVRTVYEGNAPKLTVMLNGHKPDSARLIHGGTPREERHDIIDAYRDGKFQYLVNVGIATEGFDVPDISCVVLARPTKSRALCSQMCGRGTRPASALAELLNDLPNDVARRQAIAESTKPSLLIIDFVDNTERHDLIHPPDILGGRVSSRAVEQVEKECQGLPTDIIAALERVECEIRHNDELAAAARDRQGVKAVSQKKDKDPFAIYGLIRREHRGWEKDNPMTVAQREKMEKWKIKKAETLTGSEAQQIIQEVQRRAQGGLLTLNQERVLKRYGYQTEHMSYETAHGLMDKLAANNWVKVKA